MDPTTGGRSHRYSLSVDAWSRHGGRGWAALAYAVDYHLDLISRTSPTRSTRTTATGSSNTTVAGCTAVISEYDLPASLNGLDGSLRAGAELRMDDIAPVALYRTFARERFETIRKDDVRQTQYSAYVIHDQRWTDWLRTEAGLRFDYLDFSGRQRSPGNSGGETDSIASPKLTVVLGPWAETESS
ncbi:MAG: TonB-dependent receptor [Proteobacteria bacterium]|nr:TonB-dependent receptor [Pseudomonadota bacterium]